MAYKDGGTFTTYCDKPYNKHKYKLVLGCGKSLTFDDYDVVKTMWLQWSSHCSTIKVI